MQRNHINYIESVINDLIVGTLFTDNVGVTKMSVLSGVFESNYTERKKWIGLIHFGVSENECTFS